MGFYHDRALPCLIHLSMRQQNLIPYRQRVTTAAEGRILEVGVGSGLNLPFYSDKAAHVIVLDPSPRLLGRARNEAVRAKRPVELLEGSAEAIPLQDRTVDTVVTTWTLCTIPAVLGALGEMRRVLRPGGQLLFVEHGLAPEASVQRWQDRLTPVWKRIGGGCHLNRSIAGLIEAAGFHIDRLETGYMKGPKPMTFTYEGRARPQRHGPSAGHRSVLSKPSRNGIGRAGAGRQQWAPSMPHFDGAFHAHASSRGGPCRTCSSRRFLDVQASCDCRRRSAADGLH